MAGILNVDTIQDTSGRQVFPAYLARRVVQRVVYVHRQGWCYPDNTYYFLPGTYVDFRPIRNDTRVRVSLSIPMMWYGSAHHISHWVFYRDDIEYGRHTNGGHHTERASVMQWDIPTWGAGQYARVGYRVRAYASGNHSTHLFHVNYWDGGGNNWNPTGQISVEEYFPIS
jgi:hypothetical protein